MANAAMLPLVGQKLALPDKNLGTSLMSACIVAAQIVMVPMAMLVGVKANEWGRKPLFLAGFLILPLRGILYTFSNDAYWLVAHHVLQYVVHSFFSIANALLKGLSTLQLYSHCPFLSLAGLVRPRKLLRPLRRLTVTSGQRKPASFGLLPVKTRGRVSSPPSRLPALCCLYTVMRGLMSVCAHAVNNAQGGKKDAAGGTS